MVYQGGNVKYRLELSAVSTDQSAERVLVAADQWEVLWSSHPGTDSGEAGGGRRQDIKNKYFSQQLGNFSPNICLKIIEKNIS